MNGRSQKTKETFAGIHIVGEGITEQYYFSHIKTIFNFKCIVKPRFFEQTCIHDIRTCTEKLLRDGAIVICVFDADVSSRNKKENDALVKFKQKYEKNKHVIICDSLPSIEFWFLIHFKETNCYYQSSADVEKALKKYLKDYCKNKIYLEKENWVRELCSKGKLDKAISWSKSDLLHNGSYSNLFKAFDCLLDKEQIAK
ncbi:MAG: RloB family protein [Bacteroidales bacterium]|nr:RloB family protein [Bacteroidales bacterium]MDD4822493.1 RloB family protein [Bacteroidales bacterium]